MSNPGNALAFDTPTVILMVGVSGAGKTKWINDNLGYLDPTVCSADDYCVDLDGNWYWTHEVVIAAHGVCKRAFNEAIARRDHLIIVDNPNLMSTHRQHYLDWARRHEYQCFIVVVDADLRVAQARSIHGTTLNGVLRQAKRLDLFPGVYYMPLKEHAITVLNG